MRGRIGLREIRWGEGGERREEVRVRDREESGINRSRDGDMEYN